LLVVPAPKPGELAIGYWGAVLRWNGLSRNVADGRQALRLFTGQSVNFCDVPRVELLAKIAAMDLESYVRHHTMFPLRRAVTKDVSGGMLGQGKYRASMISGGTLRVPRPQAYLCQECVREDLGFHGYAYWRREHQLPGQWRCDKHGATLSRVGISQAEAFYASPAQMLPQAKVESDLMFEKDATDCATYRFFDICSHLLGGVVVLPLDAVFSAAKYRAEDLGINTEACTLVRHLLKLEEVQACYDRRWLDALSQEGLTRHVFSDDVSGSAMFSTLSAALVFAALYETSEEAISGMVLSTRECTKSH
jgi:hypothetical protein